MTNQAAPDSAAPAPKLASPRKLFVNIPVADLQRAIGFFTKLGFTFNPQFTDESATCMLVGDDAYFMLLARPRFEGFSRRPVGNPLAETTAMFAVSAATRDEVESLFATAVSAGATEVSEPQDHGFMYLRSFYDLDGHHWEVFWMDADYGRE
ncbi:MAG: VOC family protein [Gemmatimonadaceae bacterium]|nr:VOC family protein [Gemmatimonadaceae bacterium]